VELWRQQGHNVREGSQHVAAGYVRSAQLLPALSQAAGCEACGYFSLFYCEVLEEAATLLLSGSTEAAAITALAKLASESAFKKFRQYLVEALLLNVQRRKHSKPSYPWTEKDVKSSCLERAYLQYFQDEGLLKGTPLPLLEFGLSSLKTNHPPLRTMEAVDKCVADFHRGGKNVQTFLVGATIHYVAGMLVKWENGDTELLVVDPQNSPFLLADESALADIVGKMEFKLWVERGWKRDDVATLALDSFAGNSTVIHALYRPP
jgi:hypothetical protein